MTTDFILPGYKRYYHSTVVDIYMSDPHEEMPNFYTGTLKGYFLTPTGELDRILLSNAKKRIRIKRGESELLDIKGDTFIVPYNNIANMNLSYNYTYQTKRKGIPKAIRNVIILLLVISLIPALIIPWFTSASIPYKISAMIILIVSWVIATGGTANFFDEEKKIKKLTYISQIIISAILLLFALYVLGFLEDLSPQVLKQVLFFL